MLEHSDGSALVEGNLTPLLAKRDKVYQIGGVQPDQQYRFFLVEKPPAGNPWPASHADVTELIARWRNDEQSKIIRDDTHVFLAIRESKDTKPPVDGSVD